MKTILVGSIAIILGIYFTSTYFTSMLSVLAGTVPLLLLLTGILIIYMNYDILFSGKKDQEIETPDDFSASLADSGSSENFADQEDLVDKSSVKEPEHSDEINTNEEVTDIVESPAAAPKPVVTETEEISETVAVIPEPETGESSGDQPDDHDIAESDVDKEDTAKDELIGNTSSLVFHKSRCQYAKSKKCTALFDNRETFIKEGYKPCGVCKP